MAVMVKGWGQILRLSLTLSILTQKPIKIFNILANRRKPGRSLQYLLSVLAAGYVCQGRIEGAKIGSTRLSFSPGAIQSGDYTFEVGQVRSTGAATLIFQTLLLPLSLAKKHPLER